LTHNHNIATLWRFFSNFNLHPTGEGHVGLSD
jgi:hypothetical protein